MPIITYTKKDNLRYTLSPTRQELVYEKLVDVLPADLSKVFLQPKIKKSGIDWIFPNDNIQIIESIPYGQMSEDQKSIVSDKLNAVKVALGYSLSSVPELKKRVDNIYDIPSLDSAKILKTNQGDFVVISDWAHVRFDKKKGYLPFEKIINKPRKSQDVNIKLIYSDKVPFSSQKVSITYKNFPKEHITNEYGVINLGKLPVSSQLSIAYTSDSGDQRIESIIISQGQTDYEIIVPFITELKVSVIDQNDKLLDNYPISIFSNAVTNEVMTSNGEVIIPDLIAGEYVEAIDGNNNEIKAKLILERENNNIELKVNVVVPPPPPEKEFLSFFIYDLNNELIEDSILQINQGGKKIKLENKDKGLHKRDKREFSLDKKAKALIKINTGGKEKKYTHRFKILTSQDEYHLKLKRNYWWFLLLLIPLLLLLLLSLSKSTVVEVTDMNNVPVANAQVEFEYSYNALFDFNRKEFFTTSNYSAENITDTLGIAEFDSIKYTVYDRVFHMFRSAEFKVMSNDVCLLDTVFERKFYNFGRKYRFQLDSKKVDLGLRVVSARTGEIIPDARVNIKVTNDINELYLEGLTDENGSVLFNSIPLCSHLSEAIGSKIDYFPDTISNISVIELQDDPSMQVLYLNEPLPCKEEAIPGGVGGNTFVINVPKQNEKYTLFYEFRGIKDRMILKSGSNVNGPQIYDTDWVAGNGEVEIVPSKICNGCDYITVEILANDPDTYWKVDFDCP